MLVIVETRLNGIIEARKSSEHFAAWVQSWLDTSELSSDCPAHKQVQMMLVSPPDSPFKKFLPFIKQTKAFLDLLKNVSNPFERVSIVQKHKMEFMSSMSLLFLDPVVELAFNRVCTYAYLYVYVCVLNMSNKILC